MFSWQFSQNLHGGFHSVFTTVFTDVCTYDLICAARVDRTMFALSERRIHIFDRATCHNVYTLCKPNLPNTYSNCRGTMRSAHTVVWSSIESYWQLISGRNMFSRFFSHGFRSATMRLLIQQTRKKRQASADSLQNITANYEIKTHYSGMSNGILTACQGGDMQTKHAAHTAS